MTTVNLTSDELAEDYKASLEDLSFNSRYEISNLTVIARENIHAAQAIARTLEQHIAHTSPARKLPALYLLDSIAKNVGTPYTLFFQRNLYSTFMDAYLVVDPPVRRKLEEMLQTWKQPCPGSTSTKPCFASDITRKIDNALIKARTVALQYQQKQRQSQQALGPGRTSTPPQGFRNGPNQQPLQGYPNGNQFNYNQGGPGPQNGQHVSAVNVRNYPQGSASYYGQTQPTTNGPISQHGQMQAPPQQMGGSVDTLQSDISSLIESCRLDVVRDPTNSDLQSRLQALLDLRQILQTQQLPEAQLAQVREQVRALSARAPPPPVAPPPPPPPVQLPFSTQDLASLLASATQSMPLPMPPQPAQRPQPPVSLPPAPPPPPPAPPANFASNGTDALSLFESLKSAGLLSGLTGGFPPPPLPGQLPFPLPGNMPASLPRIPQLPQLPQLPVAPKAPTPFTTGRSDWRAIDVELKSSSLKM